jgi:hypothetical protein
MVVQSHYVFVPPADQNIRIWRYVSLAKFVWMLQKRALYFCRCDLMEDPFEGHRTKPRKDEEDEFVGALLGEGREKLINREEAERKAREQFKTFIMGTPKFMRGTLFINCWHMNEEESFAMWKLYASRDDSICVQSTYRKLAALLPDECFLGTVRYIDYMTDIIDFENALSYIVHKRKAFEHERELRAGVWNVHKTAEKFVSSDGRGVIVPVDTSELIERVFVSLDSEPILKDITENLCRTHGVTAPVFKSEVYAGPDY